MNRPNRRARGHGLQQSVAVVGRVPSHGAPQAQSPNAREKIEGWLLRNRSNRQIVLERGGSDPAPFAFFARNHRLLKLKT